MDIILIIIITAALAYALGYRLGTRRGRLESRLKEYRRGYQSGYDRSRNECFDLLSMEDAPQMHAEKDMGANHGNGFVA